MTQIPQSASGTRCSAHHSLAESAEIAGCNVGTMKSRVHYALKALRSRLPEERRAPAGAKVSTREL